MNFRITIFIVFRILNKIQGAFCAFDSASAGLVPSLRVPQLLWIELVHVHASD